MDIAANQMFLANGSLEDFSYADADANTQKLLVGGCFGTTPMTQSISSGKLNQAMGTFVDLTNKGVRFKLITLPPGPFDIQVDFSDAVIISGESWTAAQFLLSNTSFGYTAGDHPFEISIIGYVGGRMLAHYDYSGGDTIPFAATAGSIRFVRSIVDSKMHAYYNIGAGWVEIGTGIGTVGWNDTKYIHLNLSYANGVTAPSIKWSNFKVNSGGAIVSLPSGNWRDAVSKTAGEDWHSVKINPTSLPNSYINTETAISGSVNSAVLDSSGNVWLFIKNGYMGAGTNRVVKIAPDGTPTSYNVPTDSCFLNIAIILPDDTMYCTEYDGAKLLRVMPNGDMTEYATPCAHPEGLCYDGTNIWVAGGSSHRLHKFVIATGTFDPTVYLSPSGHYIGFCCYDAFRNRIWYDELEGAASKLGYLDLGTGIMHEAHDIGGNCTAMAIDSSNVIWFLQTTQNIMSYVPETDTLATFVIPTLNANPASLTIDAEDNKWFAEYYGNKIGKLKADGNFVEYSKNITAAANFLMEWIVLTSKGMYYFYDKGADETNNLYGLLTWNDIRAKLLKHSDASVLSTSDYINTPIYQSFAGWTTPLASITENDIDLKIEAASLEDNAAIIDGSGADNALEIYTELPPPPSRLKNCNIKNIRAGP